MEKLILNTYKDALTHVIFPRMCAHCDAEIGRFEDFLCHACWEKVEPTYYEMLKENTALDKLFYVRVKLKSSYALFHFSEGNPIQSLLHNLKYKHKEKVGLYLGKCLGVKIKEMHKAPYFDAIIPVPIHPKKEFQRGYNQCDSLCRGLANILQIPVDKHLLIKNKNTESQTKNNKWARWENTLGNFTLQQRDMPYKSILIVDDVITTGSTLESLCTSLTKEHPSLEISIASIAFAGR